MADDIDDLEPGDRICPDCSKPIPDVLWSRHRRFAHTSGATPTSGPLVVTTTPARSVTPPNEDRPSDGTCPDCRKVIPDDLWIAHRRHIHGDHPPAALGRQSEEHHEPSDAERETTLGLYWASLSAMLVCAAASILWVLDNTSWNRKAAYCNAAETYGVRTGASCGFYEVMSSVRTLCAAVAILAGLVAIFSLLSAIRSPRR